MTYSSDFSDGKESVDYHGSELYIELPMIYHINEIYSDVLTADLFECRTKDVASRQDSVTYTVDYDDNETIAKIARTAMKQRMETVNVTYNLYDTMTADEAIDVYFDKAFSDFYSYGIEHTGVPNEGDYIRWQYGGMSAESSILQQGENVSLTMSYSIVYYTTAEEEAMVDAIVANLVNKLALNGISSRYEKLSAIYDWICANVAYDYEHLDDDTYTHQFTTYAAIVDGTAVCQGYATLFYRLCLEAGIDSRIITGDSDGPHAWNIAKIGKYYYLCDSTWDAERTEDGYTYFLRGSDFFYLEDGKHTPDEDYTSNDFTAKYSIGTTDCSGIEEEISPNGHAVIRQASASFEGKIILNFYLLLDDEVLADDDAYVLFTGGSQNRKILVKDATVKVVDGETRYCFTYPVVAKEMRDNINLKIYDSNDCMIKLTNVAGTNDYTTSGVNYSLMTYCTKMLESSTSSEEMKALAQATIDYGTAAQIYFDYNATGLSVGDRVTSVTLADLEQYKGVFNGTLPAGVTKRTLTALFEEDNSLRIYFTYDSGYKPDMYTYTIDGKSAPFQVKHGSNGDEYYLEVKGVPSNKLGKTYDLTISNGITTYTITVSVLTYARSSVSNGATDRQNLGKALYRYYLAAKAKFGE